MEIATMIYLTLDDIKDMLAEKYDTYAKDVTVIPQGLNLEGRPIIMVATKSDKFKLFKE